MEERVKIYINSLSLVSFLGLFFLVISSVSYADPVETVTTTNDLGMGSLRQAIADVDPGGNIIFDLPGAPPHTIALASELLIDKALTIQGPGSNLLEVTMPDVTNNPLLTINDMNTATKNIVNISGISFSIVGPIVFLPPNGIGNAEDLTLSDCVFSEFNTAIFNFGGETGNQTGAILELNNSTITMNNFGIFNLGGGTDTAEGGIILVNKSTIIMNVVGISNEGGGSLNSMGGQFTVNNSNISGNGVGISGGAGFSGDAEGSITTVNNTTISGNLSDGVSLLGGSTLLGSSGAAQITVNNSTIVNNQAVGVELIATAGLPAEVDIKNSIVGDNGTDCAGAGTFAAFGNNLDTDGTCAALSAQFTQVTSMALNLGPLQNNGGPTDTHALISPSSAIDTALDCTFISGGPVDVDQRFFPRPFGANCDIGAFEFQPTAELTIQKNQVPLGDNIFEFLGTNFPEGCPLGSMFFLGDGDSLTCTLPILPPGMDYTVQELPAPGFRISDIDCDGMAFTETADSAFGTLSPGETVTCLFTNQQVVNLVLNILGNGTGTVSSTPPGITCPGDCTETYDINTAVTLTPIADPVSMFAGWSANCPGGVIADLTADTVCTATFNLLPLILNPINPGVASNPNIITVEQATPNGNVAYLWSFQTGSTIVGGPTCNGIELGLKNPQVLGIRQAGANQIANLVVYIPLNPAFENPVFLQAADIPTCRTSEVVTNIILNE